MHCQLGLAPSSFVTLKQMCQMVGWKLNTTMKLYCQHNVGMTDKIAIPLSHFVIFIDNMQAVVYL